MREYTFKHLHVKRARKHYHEKPLTCPSCNCLCWTLVKPREPKKYPYLFKEYTCTDCLVRHEYACLAELKSGPVENIPLWIGHHWLESRHRIRYQEILKNRLGIPISQ